MTKEKRPKIPASVQLKLWIYSGGRCQLCNEPVYVDGSTLKEGNWSNIAHIISWSPSGPRGDKVLSKKLEKDFSNLMLMCTKHAKLIDTRPCVTEYPVSRLRDIKADHENRILRLTEITNESKTYALVIQSNIGGNHVEINLKEVLTAITENRMYPKENPFIIDLTGDVGGGDTEYYSAKATEITNRVRGYLDRFNSLSERQHISVFPIALMPLLVHLGKELGDKHSIQLFQHQRTPSSWIWTDETESTNYIVLKPQEIVQSKDVYLKISLSDQIGEDKLQTIPSINQNVYEITIPEPTTRFLKNRSLLPKFDAVYRLVLNEIQVVHGIDCVIHLLLAVPAPIAVQCGLSLLTRKDPTVWAYDYDKERGGFIRALKVN
jgi:hypothetical protein